MAVVGLAGQRVQRRRYRPVASLRDRLHIPLACLLPQVFLTYLARKYSELYQL